MDWRKVLPKEVEFEDIWNGDADTYEDSQGYADGWNACLLYVIAALEHYEDD